MAVFLGVFALAPARANDAVTRFAVQPEFSGSEIDVPLQGLVLSYTGTYEAMVRLDEPYLLDPKDASKGVIEAGQLLFLAWRHEDAFYCATKPLSAKPDTIPVESIFRAALGVHLFGGSINPREHNWQCFRDADGDGRFELVGGGDRGMRLPAHVVNIAEVVSLPQPLRYTPLAPSDLKPQMKFGLMVQGISAKRFTLQVCVRSLEPDALYCLPHSSNTFRLEKLPDMLEFADGKLKLQAVRTDENGAQHLHFSIETPPKSVMVSFSHSYFTDSVLEEKLWYWFDTAPPTWRKPAKK